MTTSPMRYRCSEQTFWFTGQTSMPQRNRARLQRMGAQARYGGGGRRLKAAWYVLTRPEVLSRRALESMLEAPFLPCLRARRATIRQSLPRLQDKHIILPLGAMPGRKAKF